MFNHNHIFKTGYFSVVQFVQQDNEEIHINQTTKTLKLEVKISLKDLSCHILIILILKSTHELQLLKHYIKLLSFCVIIVFLILGNFKKYLPTKNLIELRKNGIYVENIFFLSLVCFQPICSVLSLLQLQKVKNINFIQWISVLMVYTCTGGPRYPPSFYLRIRLFKNVKLV